MATDRDFIDYVAEQVGLGARITFKRLFGEYAMYLDGKVVAFACDNSLFVKPSRAATTLAPGLAQRPPYPGAKDYPVADELLDDADTIRRLIVETAAAMPEPKPARSRSRKPKSAEDRAGARRVRD
jgi:TfoX/Sxy family transcriptional regulator of competence genes